MLKDKQIVLCCRSKTGFTAVYMEWIRNYLKERFGALATLMEPGELKKADFSQCDLLIYGGGLYAGKINGLDEVKKRIKGFPKTQVILFATGLSQGRPEELERVWKANLKAREMQRFYVFYFRGGFDFDRLDRGDRLLMRLMKKKLERESGLSSEGKEMLAAFEKPVDFTNREALGPLTELLEKMDQGL